MDVQADASPVPLPAGLYYRSDKGIVVEGLVARRLAEHPIGPRPGRGYHSCALNDLAGNTTLSIIIGEVVPGGTKCGHRHFDETLMFFLTGSGRSELRQDDDRPMTRVDWRAGDLLVIPMNAWHQHFNAGDQPPARYISFKTNRVTQRLLGGGDAVRHVRLRDRYDDEPDYFVRRTDLAGGAVAVNHARTLASDPLPEAQDPLGLGVGEREYVMGGQRTLGVFLVGIAAGGRTVAHRPLAEEAFIVLSGQGQTSVHSDRGVERSLEWSAGDLVSCPLNVTREHRNTADEQARLLSIRSLFVQTGLDVAGDSLPERFPRIVDAAVDLGSVTTPTAAA